VPRWQAYILEMLTYAIAALDFDPAKYRHTRGRQKMRTEHDPIGRCACASLSKKPPARRSEEGRRRRCATIVTRRPISPPRSRPEPSECGRTCTADAGVSTSLVYLDLPWAPSRALSRARCLMRARSRNDSFLGRLSIAAWPFAMGAGAQRRWRTCGAVKKALVASSLGAGREAASPPRPTSIVSRSRDIHAV